MYEYALRIALQLYVLVLTGTKHDFICYGAVHLVFVVNTF